VKAVRKLSKLLRSSPRPTYDQDGLRTLHSADFMSDPAFSRAYQAGSATGSWGKSRIHWRVHVVLWAAQMAAGLDGDFIECGVHRGGFAAAVDACIGVRHMPRRFLLFDTFSGFDPALLSEGERNRKLYRNEYRTDIYEEVRARFADAPNIIPIKGSVPASLSTVDVKSVALLMLDMNNAAPEIAAARFFWNRITPGGLIVLDDYGWAGHEEQKQAFDEFSLEMSVPLLRIPTGQALMMKPLG
jgi:O-methyltransferase